MSDEVDLFPPGAAVDDGGDLVVGGCRPRDLAAEFGTPAYVLVGAAREHLPSAARLVIEPGRSLIARAGVTIYRVVTVKRGRGRSWPSTAAWATTWRSRSTASASRRPSPTAWAAASRSTSSGATASRATCCRPASRCASR